MFQSHPTNLMKPKAVKMVSAADTEIIDSGFPPMQFFKMKRSEKLALKSKLER